MCGFMVVVVCTVPIVVRICGIRIFVQLLNWYVPYWLWLCMSDTMVQVVFMCGIMLLFVCMCCIMVVVASMCDNCGSGCVSMCGIIAVVMCMCVTVHT